MTNTTHIVTQLTDLGLSNKEAAVYVFLLERGSAFAGSKIARALSLHRQYVYTALQTLIKLELVEEVPTGARIRYRAMPPEYLTRHAQMQLDQAKRLVRELDHISAVGAEQAFEVYRGVRQVMEFEENFVHNLSDDETQYIIGGGAEAFVTFFGEQYEELSRTAHRRSLHTQYIGSPKERAWLERAQQANKYFTYRTLPSFPTTIVQTVVRLGTVTFYSFAHPPLVYVVKSPIVAENYKAYFNMLWNMAKK